jgi:hypothetical protein
MLGGGPCHHSMTRPRVADGGTASSYGWRLAANKLNKQPRTNDKRWSPSLGVGRGAKKPSRQKINVLRELVKSLGPGRILWINDPSDEICI